MHVILLLGAGLRPDGTSIELRDRAAHAAALYHAGRGERILATGGKPVRGRTEAEVAAEFLVSGGVPPAAIVLEPEATTTWENMAYSLPILERLGATRVTLVTDGWHLPRARFTARRFGLRAEGSAAVAGGDRRLLYHRLREVPALLYYAARRGPGRG